jgi:hypothetical protein
MPKGWSMRSTVSARASPSGPSRSPASSTRPGRAGMPVKLHAEQLSNLGGAAAGGRIRRAVGRSSGICHGRRCGKPWPRPARVAVMLPGAFYTLRETVAPPVEAFREAGVPMAVATDCNPGSSPMSSLLLGMNMACTLFRLTPEEALAGVTRNAARALGLTDCGRSRRACAPISRSGTSSTRRNWPTASDSTRSASGFSEARCDADALTPGRPRLTSSNRSGAPAKPLCLTTVARRGRGVGGDGSQGGRRRQAVYGVNTGFGKLASVRIARRTPHSCSAI